MRFRGCFTERTPLLTFIKAPPQGWHLWFWEKYLDFWMDRHLVGSQLQLKQRVNQKKLNCQLLWFFFKCHSKIIIINHPEQCFLHNIYTDTDRSGIGQYQLIIPGNWYKLDPLIFYSSTIIKSKTNHPINRHRWEHDPLGRSNNVVVNESLVKQKTH